MSELVWKDDSSNLDIVAANALLNGKFIPPECCESPEIHIYGHKYRKNSGSAWIWCSHCGAFSHLDGIPISDSWVNSEKIDFSKLTAIPIYLEKMKNIVDAHLKHYAKQIQLKSA